uniref:Uncharacterized protein n=1 Tax=Anguilla anguilla TaxID=7936 RepID=A0A0E9TC91_ANGAN
MHTYAHKLRHAVYCGDETCRSLSLSPVARSDPLLVQDVEETHTCHANDAAQFLSVLTK